MSIEKAELALSKAKTNLIIGSRKSPFLATLVFGLKTEVTDAISTACTDGTHLLVNPAFFNSLDSDQQITLLAHEAYHVALSHILRLGDRDPKLWNIATDYVINLMLHKAKFKDIPQGLLDHQYDNMSADEVYAKLLKNPPKVPAPDHMMQPKDANGNPEDPQITKAKIDKLIVKAATHAKLAGEKALGDLPSDMQRAIEEALNPKLDWRTILMNHMSSFKKEDYSYRRPNKKYLPDFYMPTLYSESLGSIGVAFDASGSVSDEDFNLFKSEVDLIRNMLNPESVDLISFDTKLQTRHVITSDMPIKDLEFGGYGGTSLAPVFEHFNKNKPEVLIVFSDLECRQWTEEPDYPVIWILVGHYKVPTVHFGTLIEYIK